MKAPKIDVIVPLYWVDWKFFSSNMRSWYREIPIRKLLVGINNPDDKLFRTLENYFSHFPEIEIIDQRHFKTLGGCLVDLMNRVETPWFMYLHTDVELTEGCYNVLHSHKNANIGIIESERLHYNGEVYKYDSYHFKPRSFSGVQLIQKSCLKEALETIEDDFLYRNEDLIFQYFCYKAGFDYKKTMAMHIHQITNRKWTFPRVVSYEMQWRGISKYTNPTVILLPILLAAAGVCRAEAGLDPLEFYDQLSDSWKLGLLQYLLENHL